MGRDPGLYKRAVELRKLGQSYSDLKRELGIPKSTSSELNKRYSDKNRDRITLMAKRKKAQKLVRDRSYRIQARKEYSRLRRNSLFLAGLSLYWGEGEKVNHSRVSVINTDSKMLQVMVNFYRKILKIPE